MWRILLVVAGVLITIAGAVWTLQGLGYEGYSHDHLLQVDQGLASGDATRTAR
ncbi:MAG TPA: hypothetical protein VMV92_41085 [Streptosporangiaceae bacterium]|nr:hypothetical protein [Streptosporangiaceae bacterium]